MGADFERLMKKKENTEPPSVPPLKGGKSLVLNWVNPLPHNVYLGWLWLWGENFELRVWGDGKYGQSGEAAMRGKGIKMKERKLWRRKFVQIFGGYLLFLKNKGEIWKKVKNDLNVVGDIFCMDLVWWFLKSKRSVFYSEFFLRKEGENVMRKNLFFLFTAVFRGRKFLVPTKMAEKTFKKISEKVLFWPPIWMGKLHDNPSLKDEKLKILFLGRVHHWQKNWEGVVEVLNELDEEGLDFELIAGGFLKDEDKSVFDKVKFGKKFKWLGIVPHEKIDGFFEKGNLFLLPSLMDPIGMVVLEAAAHSLPVIVSENVGAKDAVENGKSGLIVKSGSKEELKKAVKKMMNQKLRERMGKRGRKVIEEKFWAGNKKLMKGRMEKFSKFVEMK